MNSYIRSRERMECDGLGGGGCREVRGGIPVRDCWRHPMWKTSVAWNRNFNMWCDDAMSSSFFSIQSRTVFVYHMEWKGKPFWFTFHPVTLTLLSLPTRSLCFHVFISITFSLVCVCVLFSFFWKDANLIKYDSMRKTECLIKCK